MRPIVYQHGSQSFEPGFANGVLDNVYCEDSQKITNILSGGNFELFNDKPGGLNLRLPVAIVNKGLRQEKKVYENDSVSLVRRSRRSLLRADLCQQQATKFTKKSLRLLFLVSSQLQ